MFSVTAIKDNEAESMSEGETAAYMTDGKQDPDINPYVVGGGQKRRE